MSQFRGNTGTLIVVVSRARGLPNKRKLEKQNPYCLLRLANLTDKTATDLRGGQVPRWDSEFRFHLSPEMSPLMKLSVLDETKKAPTLIAEAEVDFTPVFYASVKDGFDKWHTLYSGDGREAGEIYIEMTFYPSGGSTTFSSSGRKLGSSYGSNSSYSNASMSGSGPGTRKRQLPPPPGQKHVVVASFDDDPNAIPPPLPRNNILPQRERDSMSSSYHDVFNESMNRSQMSVHTLPEMPIHARPYPSSHTPPPARVSPPLREVPALINHHESAEERHQEPIHQFDRISSSNAFDELEREVQLNYDGPPVQHQRQRQHDSNKPKPPPLPSHSSGSLRSSAGSSSSSYSSLAPPPISHKLSQTVYDIIEPVQKHVDINNSGTGGRRSPVRKPPPSSFYKSGGTSPKRFDLSSIPYDATTITGGGDSRPGDDDRDVLLKRHNAPTPSEVFVSGDLGSSGNRSRMSPSRFRSSLPEPPR